MRSWQIFAPACRFELTRLNPIADVDLGYANALGVPSHARALLLIESRDQLPEATRLMRESEGPVRVLGEGTNLVLPEIIHGLVVRLTLNSVSLEHLPDGDVLVRADAGKNWHELVSETVEEGCFGLQNLALIPGSVGAAPVQNIGAYGVEVAEVIECVEVLDWRTDSRLTLSAAECGFGYRHSRFKTDLAEGYLILSVTFRLGSLRPVHSAYPALRERLLEEGASGPQAIFDAVCALRRERLHDPAEIPNAGSFFHNPIVDLPTRDRLLAAQPDMPWFKVGDSSFKLMAAWLIERAGWKGVSRGAVQVSSKHALVLINPGRASAYQVLGLADEIQNSVEKQFGVSLIVEPGIWL